MPSVFACPLSLARYMGSQNCLSTLQHKMLSTSLLFCKQTQLSVRVSSLSVKCQMCFCSLLFMLVSVFRKIPVWDMRDGGYICTKECERINKGSKTVASISMCSCTAPFHGHVDWESCIFIFHRRCKCNSQ